MFVLLVEPNGKATVMFIFRFEHDRKRCTTEDYRAGGKSLTGHGIASGCPIDRPNFGHAGAPPSTRMVEYERCSVTAKQFVRWIGTYYDYSCKYTTAQCNGDSNCYYCPATLSSKLNVPDGWLIMAYWVEAESEGIDWREDNHQIVFNPAYAQLIGSVELWEVEQLSGVKIPV